MTPLSLASPCAPTPGAKCTPLASARCAADGRKKIQCGQCICVTIAVSAWLCDERPVCPRQKNGCRGVWWSWVHRHPCGAARVLGANCNKSLFSVTALPPPTALELLQLEHGAKAVHPFYKLWVMNGMMGCCTAGCARVDGIKRESRRAVHKQ